MDAGTALWVLVWIVCGTLSYFIARGTGRDPVLWGVIGFAFGPLGLIATLLLAGKVKKKKTYPPSGRVPDRSRP